MARYCLLLVLSAALLCSVSGQATSTVTLSSLGAPKLSVNLTYMIDGQKVQLAAPCTSQAPGSACLPQVQAARDEVLVSYAVMPQYTVNTSDTVLLKACYSNFSSVDRPWRASNDVIALSKRCPFVIAQKLNPGSGNVTWKVPNTVPLGTYFVRALVYNGINPVAVGNSAGYFQVNKINIHPTGLVAASAVCICVGPVIFVILLIRELRFKKRI